MSTVDGEPIQGSLKSLVMHHSERRFVAKGTWLSFHLHAIDAGLAKVVTAAVYEMGIAKDLQTNSTFQL